MNEYERHYGGAPGSGVPQSGARTPEEIEREIEVTRERMGRDIDELGERLNPSNLKRQAKEAISGKAQEVADSVKYQARYTGFKVIDFIQENPSLVAAMGLGAVWLVQQRNRSEVSGDRMARFAYTGPERRRNIGGRIADRAGEVREAVGDAAARVGDRVGERAGEWREQAGEAAGRVRERAGEIGSETRERARELGHQAREQGRRVRGTMERMLDQNPLALAAGAAVLGLALGLLVPESERERRLMGPARDQLAERAQHTAGRVKEVAREAGHEVKEAVREEIASRGPELKSTIKDAAQSVGQQVKQSAGRVTEEAKQAAKQPPADRGTTPA